MQETERQGDMEELKNGEEEGKSVGDLSNGGSSFPAIRRDAMRRVARFPSQPAVR